MEEGIGGPSVHSTYSPTPKSNSLTALDKNSLRPKTKICHKSSDNHSFFTDFWLTQFPRNKHHYTTSETIFSPHFGPFDLLKDRTSSQLASLPIDKWDWLIHQMLLDFHFNCTKHTNIIYNIYSCGKLIFYYVISRFNKGFDHI